MKLSSSVRRCANFCLIAGAAVAISVGAYANEIQVPYNLAASATSKPIVIPGLNTPVSVTCSQNQVGFRGVGQATMLRVTVASTFLEWVGSDVATTTLTSGFSSSNGTHIIYCDFSKGVDMQVESAESIKIVNTSGQLATGVITFVW